MKIRELLKNIEVKKIYLGIIIFILLAIIVIAIKGTHAFYNNSATIPFINATVGNFLNKTEGNIDKPSDINVLIYMQTQDDENHYLLLDSMPLPIYGYKLNKEKSNCIPNKDIATYSDYSINNDGTINLTTTMDKPYQLVCRIYYDKTIDSDLVIYALVEDSEYGTELYNDKRYRFTANIPDNSDYTYNNIKCLNEVNVIYNDETGLNFTANEPNVCYAYFDKIGG